MDVSSTEPEKLGAKIDSLTEDVAGAPSPDELSCPVCLQTFGANALEAHIAQHNSTSPAFLY